MDNIFNAYLHLLKDPAHLMLEVTMIVVVDGILLGIAWPMIKRAVHRHDREHHNDDNR